MAHDATLPAPGDHDDDAHDEGYHASPRGYLIGFATGGMEVGYFFWMYVPLMSIIVLHDAKRMLIDAVPGAQL